MKSHTLAQTLGCTVEKAEISGAAPYRDHGLLITFDNKLTAFFDATWLYDHHDVAANYPLGEDLLDI